MSLLSEDREPFRLFPLEAPDDTGLFSFSGSVGPNGENRREDVIKAQTLLARTGDFDPDGSFKIPTGWPSSDLYRGIKKFQKRNGMDADGTLLPVPPGGVDQHGIGETIEALRTALGDDLAGQKAPTTQQVDAHYEAEAKRQATGEDAPMPISAQKGIVLSDVPGAGPPLPKPGQQIAQALPINPAQFAPPPSGGTPDQHRDENGVSPAEKQVGRMLEQRVNEKINLLTLPVQVMNHVRENGTAFKPAPEDKPTPPSKPMSDADQASTRTPPLTPPEADTKLQGRPAEEPEQEIEKLIPPRMKKWMEGRGAFDQELAKELLLVFNSRGGDPTQAGNDLIVKEIFDVLDKNHPKLRKWMTHTHGATLDGDGTDPLKEEYLRNFDQSGNFRRKGSGRPDITVEYARNLAERIRFNSSSQNADGTWTKPEDGQADKHAALSKERRPVMLEKLQKGEKEEIYRSKIRSRIEDALRQYEAELTEQGEFEKPDPETPAQYRYWYEK